MKKVTNHFYLVRLFCALALSVPFFGFVSVVPAHADEIITPQVFLTIRDGSTVVWSGLVPLSASTTETISVTPTESSDAINVPKNSVLGALVTADAAQPEFEISNLQYYASFDSFLINCVTIPAMGSDPRCYNWQYVVNNTYPMVGTDDYILADGDTVYLYFGTPRRVTLSAAETVPTLSVTAIAQSYDYTSDVWTPLSGAVIGATMPNPDNPWSPLEIATSTSTSDGTAKMVLETVGTYAVGLAEDYYSTTTPILVRARADNEIILRIRNGGNLGFEGLSHISSGTTTLPDSNGITHDISAKSALAALWDADQASSAFVVSSLLYYDSFGAFYIRCIMLASESCDNWQYAVNGSVPGVGADAYNLSGGDELYFFFGSPRRVSVSTPTIILGESFVATAEKYIPSSNSYAPAPGLTIGVTEENPDNPWSPVEIATSTADSSGQATFTLAAIGEYTVGILEDFYFPATLVGVTGLPPLPQTGGGGSGGGIVHTYADIPRAIAFLVSKQLPDGSFGSSLLTDWSAIALAKTSAPAHVIDALREYLRTEAPQLQSATDYERHAMALMALGINPYSGTNINYIARIGDFFDGTQVGETGLVNDDIFALIPLLRAGFSADEDIIKNTTLFILKRQMPNGSWEGSVDLTAAAVQALVPAQTLPDVPAALARARTFLRVQQQGSGGFGNAPATSWVMQAIRAFGENSSLWVSENGYWPGDSLASSQQTDGGFESVSADTFTRVWSTAYAIPSAEGKTWNEILTSFAKQTISASSASGGTSTNTSINVSVATSPSLNEISFGDTAISDASPLAQIHTSPNGPAPLSDERTVSPRNVPSPFHAPLGIEIQTNTFNGEVAGTSSEALRVDPSAALASVGTSDTKWRFFTRFFASFFSSVLHFGQYIYNFLF